MKVKEAIYTLQAYTPGRSVDEVKRLYGLEKVVKLASNENPYGSSPRVREAIQDISNYHIYPDGGAEQLRKAVAEHLGVEEERLIFSSGLDELIQIVSRALLEKGTNTVMAKETFSQYRHHAVIENCEIREIPLLEGRHNLPEMARAVDENTKIVWICNPNNPTGTYVTKEELEAFLEEIPKHVLVVIDEAYFEYVTAQDYPQTIPLLAKYENLLIMRTFSKVYGLAAFRIGYGIGSPELIKQLNVVRLPFNTSTVAQVAAITALDDLQFIEECVIRNANEREKYYQFLDEHGIPYYPSQGNFVFMQFPGKTSDEVFQYLMKKGWIVRAFPNGIRITIGKEEENEGLFQALTEMLAEQ